MCFSFLFPGCKSKGEPKEADRLEKEHQVCPLMAPAGSPSANDRHTPQNCFLIGHKSRGAWTLYTGEEFAGFYTPQGINFKTVGCSCVGIRHILWHPLLGTRRDA